MSDDPNNATDPNNDPAPNPNDPAPTDWKASLPEDLRNDPTIQSTKDLPALASQLVNAQKMLGGAIRIPGKDAGEDDWNKFYSKLETVPGVGRLPDDPSQDPEAVQALFKKLGTPESPDKYQVSRPEGVELPEGFENGYLEMLHKAGATQTQAKAFMDQLYTDVQQNQSAMQQQAAQNQSALQKAFGNALEQTQNDAYNVVAKIAGQEYADAMAQNGAFHNPTDLKFLAEVANFAKESGVVIPEQQSQGGITPSEAESRIAEILNNKDHPYHDRRKAGWEEAIREFQWLHEMKNAARG